MPNILGLPSLLTLLFAPQVWFLPLRPFDLNATTEPSLGRSGDILRPFTRARIFFFHFKVEFQTDREKQSMLGARCGLGWYFDHNGVS